MIYIIGVGSWNDSDQWREVCRVEAESPESPVTRIVSVTDAGMTDLIIAWNIANYPELASPRFLAADIGMLGTYGLAEDEIPGLSTLS